MDNQDKLEPQVIEGKAKLYKLDENPVFYNETQIFNRDFSMLAAHTFLKYHMPRDAIYRSEANILDALSASGLRALRYAQEMEAQYECNDIRRKGDNEQDALLKAQWVESGQTAESYAQVHVGRKTQVKSTVWANDISENALKSIAFNSQHQDQAVTIKPSLSDANKLMFSNQQFSVIDLDPYGHPSVFYDAAINALDNDGLLAATATDGLITCGRQPVECLVRYQSLPAQAPFCHEFSVRIVLGSLAQACVRARVSMSVLFSFYHAHYLRVFVKIDKKSKSGAADLLNHIGSFQYCKKCGAYEQAQTMGEQAIFVTTKKCKICGQNNFNAGPIWTGKIADLEFCQQLENEITAAENNENQLKLVQNKLMKAQIAYIKEEYDKKALCFDLQTLCSAIHSPCISQNSFMSYCASIGRYALPTSFMITGAKSDLTIDELAKLLYIWHQLMIACGKSKQEWVGIKIEGVKITEQNARDIFTSVGIQNIDEIIPKIQELIGETTIDITPKSNAKWKELRDMGLFEANPQKNWGPKKMK
ncbi:N2 [Hexamita inflata]|uniref:tRNA (guanine(26)-N(2))-dimethyltransferase n=1 Tax=Hexamita inflata TaxID=28002 RepID=A0AA86UBJ6_9EUKA|nr:N2 [Hexamita inflata]